MNRIPILTKPAKNHSSIIIQTLKAEGTTIIMVVHRPFLLQAADKILILRNGRQEEFGDRQALLAKREELKRVVAMPMSPPSEADSQFRNRLDRSYECPRREMCLKTK